MTTLRQQLASLAASADGVTGQAFDWFHRAVVDGRLRRLRFGSLGIDCPGDDVEPKVSEVLGWPGAAAFPGVARVELPAAGGLVQPLPIEDLKVGALALTLPVLTTEWRSDLDQVAEIDAAERAAEGPYRALQRGRMVTEAVDVVFCDPREGRHWARLTGLGVFLGGDPGERLDPEAPVRLHATPLSWFRGVAATQAAGLPMTGVAMLDPAAEAARRLLLGPPLICDDPGHAEAVRTQQKAARDRLLAELPKPGKLFVAPSGASGMERAA